MRYQDYRSINGAAMIPRLWMILLALAIPLFIICSNYFETWERTGTMGAIMADMLLSATVTSYFALTFILKTRRI
jgi:hypothetical protein